ncbi:type II toxin-antitoxin system HicB family antitoxin [Candidatus Micrarchaeota archaeon]|nr:type II toxin-antitoxin system HicB family antitoxin [Candidatus Micrarchaeota archaeon]
MKRKFDVIVEKDEDNYYFGVVPELPGCYSQGKTVEELMKNMKEAISLYLEVLREKKEKIEGASKFISVKRVSVQ